jgi:serine protease Do
VDEIIRTGGVQRPYIGVRPQHLSSAAARQAGLSVPAGAAVVDVVPDSPADKAGIRRGDVIVRLGGEDITEETPYLNLLVKQRPNSTIPVTVLRDRRELTVDVAVGLR